MCNRLLKLTTMKTSGGLLWLRCQCVNSHFIDKTASRSFYLCPRTWKLVLILQRGTGLYWLFVRGIHWWIPSQRTSNAGSVSWYDVPMSYQPWFGNVDFPSVITNVTTCSTTQVRWKNKGQIIAFSILFVQYFNCLINFNSVLTHWVLRVCSHLWKCRKLAAWKVLTYVQMGLFPRWRHNRETFPPYHRRGPATRSVGGIQLWASIH